jgi:hypothetical protein
VASRDDLIANGHYRVKPGLDKDHKEPTYPCEYTPLLDIKESTFGSDYVVKVKANPATAVFYSSSVTGDTADLDEDDVTGNGGNGTQVTAAHEFGHLLGLPHPGGRHNSPAAYDADASALMGRGMEMRPSYYQLWVDYVSSRATGVKYKAVVGP